MANCAGRQTFVSPYFDTMCIHVTLPNPKTTEINKKFQYFIYKYCAKSNVELLRSNIHKIKMDFFNCFILKNIPDFFEKYLEDTYFFLFKVILGLTKGVRGLRPSIKSDHLSIPSHSIRFYLRGTHGTFRTSQFRNLLKIFTQNTNFRRKAPLNP